MPSTIEAFKILAANLYDNIDVIPGSAFIKDYVKRSYQNDPFRVALEALLLFFAMRYMIMKRYQLDSNYVKLTEKEIDGLVEEWKPEPLIPEAKESVGKERELTIKRHDGLNAVLPNGTRLQNWSVFNFLDLHNSNEMKAKCADIVKGYGVGTCGPSGFYGTIDVHLNLQKELTQIFGAEGAIIYAQGYSAVSSVIPAFSKKFDVIVADECVNFAIQRGLTLSKSQIYFYKHNDMKDLESILIKIDKEQKKKKTPLPRRFIVTEGLFQNTGTIPPLPEIIAIKKKYRYRLILDESISFGTIGPSCRGVTDYYSIPSSSVESIVGSLSATLGAAGGFCVGDKTIIDHQVLSSLAYCYSASLPAFLAAAAIFNINKLAQNGPQLSRKLLEYLGIFKKEFSPYPNGMEISGNSNSPMFFLAYKNDCTLSTEDQRKVLEDIIEEMKKSNILLSLLMLCLKDEKLKYNPKIKITISTGYSTAQVSNFASLLLKAAKKCNKLQ